MSKIDKDDINGCDEDEMENTSSPNGECQPDKCPEDKVTFAGGLDSTENGTLDDIPATTEDNSTSHDNQLKKDDSGIIVEKSPGRAESESESSGNECDTSMQKLSPYSNNTDKSRPSMSNESGCIDIDVSTTDTEEGAVGNYDVNSDDENPDETDDIESSVKKKRKQDSSDDDTDGSDESRNVSEDENHSEDDKDDKEIDLSPPPDKWRPLHEIIAREKGWNNRFDYNRFLRLRAGGSINLARRLSKYCTLDQHEGCVNCLHFNNDGTLLASGSDDLSIIVWDWAQKKPFITFDSGHRSNVFQCKFMPFSGDTHIVSCARDGQIRLAELSSTGTCKNTKKLAQHKGAAHKLSLLDDSSHVFYSCGEDAVVFEIDIREEKPNRLCITKENSRKIPLYSIHSNPFKSHEFCVGGRDHFIRIYDTRMMGDSDDNCLKKYCPQHLLNDDHGKANVTCAVYSWNGAEIIGTYNDEDIYMFNNEHSDGANFTHRYVGHRNNATVKGVNFYGPRSEFIVSGSDCGHIFLWEKESEKIVTYFQGDDGGVINVLEPHPHNPYLATSGLDHDVKIWLPLMHEPNKLDGLKQIMKRNKRERDEERMSEPDMLDGHMMWVLLQRLRRSARRQARDDGEEVSPSSGDSDTESDADSDGGPPQCVQS